MARKHKKIYPGMSDRKRKKTLNGKVLLLATCHSERINEIDVEESALKTRIKNEAKPIVRKLVKEFDLKGEYDNSDIEVSFNASENTFSESISKQKGEFINYGKMLTCFREVINNAVGIEAHTERYDSSKPSLKNAYVLLSGFVDNENIVPVKLVVKELTDAPNKLHLAVALEPIKKAAICTQLDKNRHTLLQLPVDNSSATDTISIRHLAKKINPVDGDFLKYFPDNMLTREQIAAKEEAKAKEGRYIADKIKDRELKEAIRKGGGIAPVSVQKAIDEKANAKRKTQGKKSGICKRHLNRKNKNSFWGM